MLDFTNQVVVVTGSGSPKGIGRTIAKHLLIKEQNLSLLISMKQV